MKMFAKGCNLQRGKKSITKRDLQIFAFNDLTFALNFGIFC